MEAPGSGPVVGSVHQVVQQHGGVREAHAHVAPGVVANMPVLMNVAVPHAAAAVTAVTPAAAQPSVASASGMANAAAASASGLAAGQSATAAALAAMAMNPQNIVQMMEHPPRPMAFDKVR